MMWCGEVDVVWRTFRATLARPRHRRPALRVRSSRSAGHGQEKRAAARAVRPDASGSSGSVPAWVEGNEPDVTATVGAVERELLPDPGSVEEEFRGYLECGIPTEGAVQHHSRVNGEASGAIPLSFTPATRSAGLADLSPCRGRSRAGRSGPGGTRPDGRVW